MTPSDPAYPKLSLSRVDFVGTILLLVLLLALGLLGSSNILLGSLVPVLAVGVATALRALPPTVRARAAAPAPILFGAALLSLVAANALLTDALAGAVGLALLAWWSWDPVTNPRPRSATGYALRLPLLAVALALAISLLLPRSTSLVGLAAALIVGVLLYVAWLLSHPVGVVETQASSS